MPYLISWQLSVASSLSFFRRLAEDAFDLEKPWRTIFFVQTLGLF